MSTSPKRRTARKSAPKTLPKKAPAAPRKAASKTVLRLPAPLEPVRLAADESPSLVLEFAGAFAQFGRMPHAADLFGGAERLAEFNRRNVRALLESGDILTRGCGELGTAWLGVGQQSLSDGAALAQDMAATRTPQDLATLQSEWARAQFDRLQHDAARISELSARLAGAAWAPIPAWLADPVDLAARRAEAA